MSRRRLRVGMIGLGGISYAHEAGFAESAERAVIVAVCDIDDKVARGRAEPYRARAYTSYQELVRDPDIDLVDIALPHSLHHPAALAALENKKHVLIEKPIALTSSEALELIHSASEAGVKFTVAENTRFVTAYLEAEKVIKENLLGDIRLVRTLIAGSEVARIKDPSSWVGSRAEKGVILDSGVHTYYLLKWFFGGVRDIQAFSFNILPESEVEDNATLIGHLVNGAQVVSGLSCTAEAPWTERLEVYGSKGTLVVDQLCNPPAMLFLGPEDVDGRPLEGVPYEPLAWKYLSIVEEVKDFVNAVWEDRTPMVDPMDGYHALRVVEAAYVSAAEGRKVAV